jgi:drug/metabolite transporter (DMT)-like permease
MQFGKTWKMVPKPLRQLIVLVIGVTLIVIGGLLIVLPGPFTLPFIVAGLVVLAAEFVWAERILERTKHHAKKVDPRKLLKKKKPPHENS